MLTPNCTRNHVVTYTKNIREKFTRFWLAEIECICHVTRVQSWNMNTNYNQRARCQNFVCLAFDKKVRTWFLVQFLIKGHLKNFQRLQITLVICYGLVKYLVFDKITRFLSFCVVVVVVVFLKLCPYYFVLLPKGCSVSFEAKSSFPYSF